MKTWLRQRVKPLLEDRLGVVGSVTSVRTPRRDIVLTFDDGPQPKDTATVLDALSSAGATATFFVLGTRVRAHGDLLMDVVAAGHEVALHGPDHRAVTQFSSRGLAERTRVARQQLEDRIAAPVRWFRPPYGRQSLRSWWAIRSLGLETVLWSATTWDWKPLDEDARVAKALEGARPGAIVLCHDGTAGPADGAADEALPPFDRGQLITRVLSEYAERGLRARSLGEALDHGTPVKRAVFSR